MFNLGWLKAEFRTSRTRKASRPLRLACLTTAVLYVVAYAMLPVPSALLCFPSEEAAMKPGAMTEGCAKKTCCTSRCYLDENGVHHCVPEEGESCGCCLSSIPNSSVLVPASELPFLPVRYGATTYLQGICCIEICKKPTRSVYLPVPTPPP